MASESGRVYAAWLMCRSGGATSSQGQPAPIAPPTSPPTALHPPVFLSGISSLRAKMDYIHAAAKASALAAAASSVSLPRGASFFSSSSVPITPQGQAPRQWPSVPMPPNIQGPLPFVLSIIAQQERIFDDVNEHSSGGGGNGGARPRLRAERAAWTHEVMMEAVKFKLDPANRGRSYRYVADRFGVAHPTLHSWCERQSVDAAEQRKPAGRPTTLAYEDEVVVHQWITHRFHYNQPVSMPRVRAALREIARQRGIAMDDTKCLFGSSWWRGFISRHGLLVVRNARKLHDRLPSRAMFDAWFKSLDDSVDFRHLAATDPGCLWNMDETGRDGRKVNMRVIAVPGQRGARPNLISPAFRDHYTLIVTTNAKGEGSPVMWIIKGNAQPSPQRKSEMLFGCTSGAIIWATRNHYPLPRLSLSAILYSACATAMLF